MHEKNIFLDKPMITSSHFNRLYRSLYACKLQYLYLKSVGYCIPETTISQRSPLADYFDDQNKSVQWHCIVVRGNTCWWRRQEFFGGMCYWHKPTAAAETADWVCSVLTASAGGE